MAYLRSSLPVLYFCLRVLFFAVLASPVCAQEPVPDQVNASQINIVQSLPELPSPNAEYHPKPKTPEVVSEEHITQKLVGEEDLPSEKLDNQPGNYWIVSSRRALQNVHQTQSGSWHLDVYSCQPGVHSRATKLQELSQQLIPGVPVCVFSHGSFVKWENHFKQANQAFHNLGWATGKQPLQFIFYTWPSDGPYSHIPQVDVAIRGKRAEFNGFHVANLLSHIPESCPVTLVGHSHGTRVVLSALELAAGGTVQGFSLTKSVGQQRRLRAVLAAGAIDHNWLNPGQRYGRALNRVECLLNLRNQNDLPLALYPLSRPFARRPLARLGITERDTATIGNYNAAKIRQVDVTNILGRAHYWPDYYSDSQILAAVAPYLVSF
ncbi:alpha/beta hydrolase [bacterium]|jgi:hypothetical protein|nr:alpha/beta hydrolase [bacterium]